ncbi:MAG: peptidase M41, partial [Flavobacteriaceae bacterium]|nr:peptidase M41 [Flavobacteriaceae bacterium]
IDEEISLLIETQYQRAIDVINENKDKLTELAEQLLEKEVIFSEDLVKIFGERAGAKHTIEEPVKSALSKPKAKAKAKPKTKKLDD